MTDFDTNLTMTVNEAKIAQSKYNKAYPQIKQWFAKMAKQILEEAKEK